MQSCALPRALGSTTSPPSPYPLLINFFVTSRRVLVFSGAALGGALVAVLLG